MAVQSGSQGKAGQYSQVVFTATVKAQTVKNVIFYIDQSRLVTQRYSHLSMSSAFEIRPTATPKDSHTYTCTMVTPSIFVPPESDQYYLRTHLALR